MFSVDLVLLHAVGVTQYQLVFTGLTRSIPADWLVTEINTLSELLCAVRVDAHISFNTDMSRTPNMQWQQNYRMRRSDYNPYSFEKTGLTANPGTQSVVESFDHVS